MDRFLVILLVSVAVILGCKILEPGDHTANAAHEWSREFLPLRLNDGTLLHVARYEVTVAQWRSCVTDGRCRKLEGTEKADPTHPATTVDWFDTQNYIDWLRTKTGLNVRLPTYDEWLEVASNHKPAPRKKLFKDPRLAWAADYDMTAEPKQKSTLQSGGYGYNDRGLFDIRGNVWEWTATECGTPAVSSLDNCRSGQIAMGEHVAILSAFIRDPGNAGCGAGIPPTNLGFRIVY